MINSEFPPSPKIPRFRNFNILSTATIEAKPVLGPNCMIRYIKMVSQVRTQNGLIAPVTGTVRLGSPWFNKEGLTGMWQHWGHGW